MPELVPVLVHLRPAGDASCRAVRTGGHLLMTGRSGSPIEPLPHRSMAPWPGPGMAGLGTDCGRLPNLEDYRCHRRAAGLPPPSPAP